MSARSHYHSATEAIAEATEAIKELDLDTVVKIQAIVAKAYRSGVEEGLAIGSRTADQFADAAFAKGFMEGQKHGVFLADLGTVCENHLDLGQADLLHSD